MNSITCVSEAIFDDLLFPIHLFMQAPKCGGKQEQDQQQKFRGKFCDKISSKSSVTNTQYNAVACVAVWISLYRCYYRVNLCRARDVPILLSIVRSAGVYTGTACSRTAEQAPNNFPWLISRLFLYPTGGRVSPPIRIRRFRELAKFFFILKSCNTKIF